MSFFKILLKSLVAIFLAALVPAVLSLAILSLWSNQRINYESVEAAFFVTLAHVIIFGLPAVLIMTRGARAKATSAILVGFMVVIPITMLMANGADPRQPVYLTLFQVLLVNLCLGSISATGTLSAWYIMKKL